MLSPRLNAGSVGFWWGLPFSLTYRWPPPSSVLTWSLLCACARLVSPLIKDTSAVGFGSCPYDPYLTLITFLKVLSANTFTLGVKALPYEFEGGHSQSITESNFIVFHVNIQFKRKFKIELFIFQGGLVLTRAVNHVSWLLLSLTTCRKSTCACSCRYKCIINIIKHMPRM